MSAISDRITIALPESVPAELVCRIGLAVWLALDKRKTIVVQCKSYEVVHRAEPAPSADVYICASLNGHIVVSARCVLGSPAHARAAKAAKKFWPNHLVEALTIEALAEREKAGKKIETAEGLPSI